MRHDRRNQAEPPGQDSFLDIVANLVGILIILVMVVGARAKVGFINASDREKSAEQQATIERMQLALTTTRKTAQSLELDNNEIEQKIALEEAAIEMRRAERERLLVALSLAEREKEKQAAAVDERTRVRLSLEAQLAASLDDLQDLQKKRLVAENAEAPVGVIEHLPTPMAKTVFGNEVHFRLMDHHLVYVPLNELVDEMKTELPVMARKLANSPSVIETVGPMGGFRLRYQLRIARQSVATSTGMVSREGAEFAGFMLVPVTEPLGEPLDVALRDGSAFRRIIDSLNPESTTVTVWVYPDSFNDFRRLKEDLFHRGFLTASWPMPDGHPITGGPGGRRSTAQ